MYALQDPSIQTALAHLHEAAAGDVARWEERRRRQAAAPASSDPDPLIRMGEMYIAVSPEEGRLLYLLARAARARTLVEFGASYGISTLYLGAAARDNRGRLITTEVHPDKCAATRANIAAAGLSPEIALLEGDALVTLTCVEGDVDFVFLDGWKSLYLPVLQILLPKLRPGSLVVADNIDFESAQPYLAYVRAEGNGFVTEVMGDLALSCYTNTANPGAGVI